MYAVYQEVKRQHVLDTFENGGRLDAFRHTFAMSYFSKFVSAEKLHKLGIAHEKANYYQYLCGLPDEDGELSDSLSSVMDLKNNSIALSHCKAWKKLTITEIREKVIDMIRNGEVFIIKRNRDGFYVDCESNIIPPEKLKRWNSPKCLIASGR